MSRQQFSSANNIGKVFTFQKSGSTASFDPVVFFGSNPNRVSWRLDNGSGTTQIAGNSIVYTGFTYDSNLRTIEMRGNSFNDISQFQLQDDNLFGVLDMTQLPDLSSIFSVNSNPYLTGITHAPSSNSFVQYWVQDCNLVGHLDLTPLSGLGGQFYAHSNPNLTGITHAPSSNALTFYYAYACNLMGNLDVSPLSNLGGYFSVYGNSSLTSITHSYSSNNFFSYSAYGCNLKNNLNLSMLPGLGGQFIVNSNLNLTGITHTASTNVFYDYSAVACNLIGNHDISMLQNIGGQIAISSNPLLTGITFTTASTESLRSLNIASCNIQGTIDLTPFNGFGATSSATTSQVKINGNLAITDIIFPISNGFYYGNNSNNNLNAAFNLNACSLGYIDFKPLSGSTLISGVTIGIPRFELYGNGMTTAEVNHILSDLDLISSLNYSGWTATSGTTGGYVDITSNSAPDGSSGGYNGTGATINLLSKGWLINTD